MVINETSEPTQLCMIHIEHKGLANPDARIKQQYFKNQQIKEKSWELHQISQGTASQVKIKNM